MPQFIFACTIIFSFFPFEPYNSKYFHVFFACPVRNVSTLYLYMHVSRSDALSILGTLRMSYIRLVRKSHRIQLLLPVWCHLWNVNGTDNEYRGCMHFSGQVSIKFFKGGEMSYNTTSTFFKWLDVRKTLIDLKVFVNQSNFYLD